MPDPRPVQTRIAYPSGGQFQQFSQAYCLLDDGVLWGPLKPYVPDRHEPGWGAGIIPINEGETIDDVMRHQPSSNLIETPVLQSGQYHPRIWRGGLAYSNRGKFVPTLEETPFLDSFVGSLEQIESLFESLSAVFRVAHPAPDNLDAYGGAIRDLIILSCTEVEAQWKGILTANGFPRARCTTNDYVRLRPVMRLDEYEVKLARYPSLPQTVPFKGWDSSDPTKSLAWYDVYNQVKHDREANFKDASLKQAIQAVAGCVVMLAAQFGERTLRDYGFENVFRFTKIPEWKPKDGYYGPIPNLPWEGVNCLLW